VYLDGNLKGTITTRDCSDSYWNTFIWSSEIISLGDLNAGSSHTIRLVLAKGGSWGVNIDRLGIYAKGYYEVVLHPLGARPDTIQTKNRVGFYSSGLSVQAIQALPASADLTAQLPPVGNQGNQSSCVAWAVAYALKTYQEKVEENWDVQTDTCHQFSPSWIYNQINGGYDLGSYPSDALDLLVNKGCDTLCYFPYYSYDWTAQPDYASYQRAINFKSLSWFFINTVNDMKFQLANGNAVICTFRIYPDFDELNVGNPIYDDANPYSDPQYPDGYRGYHAVCLVGYDDSKQAFKLINSWGATDWGLQGYGWLSYQFCNYTSPIDFSAYYVKDALNYRAAYWKFDEGSGYQLTDSSACHNDGTITGNPGWTAGMNGGALSFNGFTYVNFADPKDFPDTLNNSTFSITAWVKPDPMQNPNMNYGIINWGSWNYNEFHTQVNFKLITTPSIPGGIQNDWGGAIGGTAYPTIFEGAWHHVATTYDKTTGIIRNYMDGQYVTTYPSHNPLPLLTAPLRSLKIGIGMAGVYDEWFHGSMDELTVWRKCLTAEEIQKEYRKAINP
jgi:C1A family cysteine protease